MFNKVEGERLIKLARNSISCFFSKKEPVISNEIKSKFKEKQGVFVTLKINNELRGCIGYAEGIFPLYEAVINAAKAAAFSDPRFAPLTEEEFKKVRVEVSILTEPELIKVSKPEEYMEKIKIGEDGLIVKSTYGSGLLLPQVPIEWKWDVKEFLEHICEKAGLEKDAWKDLQNKIYKFQAEVFEEG